MLRPCCTTQYSDAATIYITMLSLFPRKRPQDDEVVEMSILKAPYYFAAFVGDRFGTDMCGKFFPDCTHEFGEMLSFVNKFDITPVGSRA